MSFDMLVVACGSSVKKRGTALIRYGAKNASRGSILGPFCVFLICSPYVLLLLHHRLAPAT